MANQTNLRNLFELCEFELNGFDCNKKWQIRKKKMQKNETFYNKFIYPNKSLIIKNIIYNQQQ